ncbi:VWA domain-containing protein [Actinomadura syzygii]|uniref:VWA domain-containing protein n=2 Tax=Actinomadura syzygii TaxID=1427538 RepID=A0A5D0UJC6_9ACTN|nr:VWA domain-containing protein [Actinomadura syzygii]
MMPRRRRAFVRPTGRVALIAALLTGQLIPLAPVRAESGTVASITAAGARAGAPEPTLMDVSILVDESGSLSDADVRAEISAATTIALGGLNSRSRVSIYGFGSQNQPGQNAITAACPPTVLDSPVKKDSLAACVRKLHRRADGEGNDTDHAAALANGLSALNGGPQGALKVVFLLTDGRLDVHRSPNYGRIEEDRNTEAQKQVETQLALAAANRVQIWPLGFGGQIDRSALDAFAAGGYQGACDERADSKPRARVVRDSGDVLRSLAEAFAASGCAGVSRSDETTLGAGETRELKIDIPIIATDGNITVAKGDPRVRVDYVDPAGQTVPGNGRLGESVFKRAGENATVETLSVVNPRNGRWKIRLTAPDRLSRQLVSATAIWQGAVSSSLVVEPPSARTGQPVTVRLSLITRRGAITDAKALAGLNFTVQATGAALTAPQNIVIRDDGKTPDDRAGDGRYAGAFTAPQQPGDVTFTGVVSGYGVRAEKVPVTMAVGAQAPALQGRVAFSSGSVVHPGDAVRGTVTMENTGAPVRGRLVLDGPGGARATLVGSTDLAVGQGTTTRPFKVRFPEDARLGGASMTVKVVDAADLSKVYANGQLTITVKNPPTWVEAHRYEIAGVILLVLLLALLAYLRRRAHRARIDVRGLFASLRQDGEEVAVLKAPGKWASEFRFVVHDGADGDPGLDYPRSGDSPVRARRGAPGKVVVQIPAGPRYEVEVGGEGEPYEESGLMLAFTDTRARGRAWSRGAARGPHRDARPEAKRGGATGGSQAPDDPRGPDLPEERAPASQTYEDPWL